MKFNRLAFFIIMSLFIGGLCGLQFASLIGLRTQPRQDAMREPLPTGGGPGSVDRLIVLDRIVDGAYGVFLIGLAETEVIVALEPGCADVLSTESIPVFARPPHRRERIAQKQNTLRHRGSQLIVAE